MALTLEGEELAFDFLALALEHTGGKSGPCTVRASPPPRRLRHNGYLPPVAPPPHAATHGVTWQRVNIVAHANVGVCPDGLVLIGEGDNASSNVAATTALEDGVYKRCDSQTLGAHFKILN